MCASTETVKYSPQAREALERFNIRPYRVPVAEESARAVNEIFLGLVFTCGQEEFTIRSSTAVFLSSTNSMRSVRVVSRAKRRKVGVLNTPAKLFGAFDFQARTQSSDWSIVAELRQAIRGRPGGAGNRLPKGPGCHAGGSALLSHPASSGPADSVR